MILGSLSESQLLREICYLCLTVAPDIRQRRRVKLDNGQIKMQKLTLDELKISIKNVLKPVNDLIDNITKKCFNC